MGESTEVLMGLRSHHDCVATVTEQPLKVQEAVTIDSMNPTTVEEFDQLEEALSKKLKSLEVYTAT